MRVPSCMDRHTRLIAGLSFSSTLPSLGGRYYFDSVQLQSGPKGGGKGRRLASRDSQHRQHDKVRIQDGGDGSRRGVL